MKLLDVHIQHFNHFATYNIVFLSQYSMLICVFCVCFSVLMTSEAAGTSCYLVQFSSKSPCFCPEAGKLHQLFLNWNAWIWMKNKYLLNPSVYQVNSSTIATLLSLCRKNALSYLYLTWGGGYRRMFVTLRRLQNQLTAAISTSEAKTQMLKSCDFTSGSVTWTVSVGDSKTMIFFIHQACITHLQPLRAGGCHFSQWSWTPPAVQRGLSELSWAEFTWMWEVWKMQGLHRNTPKMPYSLWNTTFWGLLRGKMCFWYA